MKGIHFSTVIVLSLFALSADCRSQSPDPRIELVRSVYRQMSAAIAGSGSYELEAQSAVVRRGRGGLDTVRSTLLLSGEAGRSWLRSGDVEMIQDSSTTVLIIANSRMILIRSTDSSAKAEEPPTAISSIRDTLFALGRVTACDTVMERGVGMQRITLVFDPRIQAVGTMRSVSFVLDISARRLRQMHVAYGSGPSVSTEIVIDRLEIGRPIAHLKSSALAHIMAAGNQLLPQYTDFRVLDRRTPHRSVHR